MNLLDSKLMKLIPAQYNAPIPEECTDDITCKLASYHLDRLTPEGWLAGRFYADCIALRDLPHLRDYDPDVLDLSAADQYHLRQVRALFAKRRDHGVRVDCESAALRVFGEAEEACKLTNACFRAWSSGRFQFRPDVEALLHGAQWKISQLFGDAPTLDELRPRFGPGANTDVPKRLASIWRKLQKAPACSKEAANWAEPLLNGFTTYTADGVKLDLKIVPGKLSFAPKNSRIYRVTVTEPPLNGVWQLGLGDFMARALRRVGIDIRDQGANQRAALYASISDESATVDMKSASDTVASLLAHHLWSDDWYALFATLRTGTVVDPNGVSYELEKISSMGNGFTFALETAIFWALAQAAKDLWAPRHRQRVLVYGDDIVVPSCIAERFMRCLKDLGFTPNFEKSFVRGTFRESCGCDYVSGINVRPYYIKGHNERDDPAGPHGLKVSDLFVIHNAYARRKDWRAADAVARLIPGSIRLRGPDGYGDGHLISGAYVTKRASPHKGWSGYTFDTWGNKPRVGRDVRLPSEIRKYAVMRNFRLGPPVRGESSATERKLKVRDYERRHYWHVIRVATYAAYSAQDALPADSLMLKAAKNGLMRPSQYFHGLGKAMASLFPCTPSDGEAPFVVPGVGEVKRTAVYIFEPLLAQQR